MKYLLDRLKMAILLTFHRHIHEECYHIQRLILQIMLTLSIFSIEAYQTRTVQASQLLQLSHPAPVTAQAHKKLQ